MKSPRKPVKDSTLGNGTHMLARSVPNRRDHFFDPWLTVNSKTLAAQVANIDSHFSATADERVRRRRSKDQNNLQMILGAVYANLAYAHVAGVIPPTVAVPLAKPKTKMSRYERRGFRLLPRVLERLEASNVLRLNKSRERGWASTIEPSELLMETFRPLRRLSFADFGRADGEESIILSRSETDHATGTRITDWIDYEDTAATHAYRAELEQINAALASAALSYEAGNGPIDTHRRKLRRVFNIPQWSGKNSSRFNLGGRLYGGWWQNLERSQRAFIRIDGEPVADLDFKSMFARLAYLHVGVTPTGGDLYAGIKGFDDPRYRDGIKKVFNAMLFRKSLLGRLPRGTREQLPQGATAATIRAAIFARHPDLKPIFETGIGFNLMFTESRILVDILLKLSAAGVVALPMHDGLMVAAKNATRTARIMGDIAEELTGCRLPTERK